MLLGDLGGFFRQVMEHVIANYWMTAWQQTTDTSKVNFGQFLAGLPV